MEGAFTAWPSLGWTKVRANGGEQSSVVVIALMFFMPAIGNSETHALQFAKSIGVA